jgi:hypothetical protein
VLPTDTASTSAAAAATASIDHMAAARNAGRVAIGAARSTAV